MGLFRSRAPEGEQRSTMTMQQLALMTSGTTAGDPGVSSADEALGNAAVWACIDVLAGSVSSLPVGAVSEQADIRVPVQPEPPLLARPSAFVTLDVWLYQLMWSLLTDGNAFGLVTTTDGMERATSIELLDPASVTQRTVSAGRATAVVDGRKLELYPRGPLWHVPGKMTKPGSPFAMSPVAYASRSIGTAIEAERYGGRFFTDGGHPSAIVSSDTELTSEQAGAVKSALMKVTGGSREPAVFGSGLTYTPIQTNPNDSQFIELLHFEVEQVCRFYRVPPTMVYGVTAGQNITYQNVSQSDLAYLKHSLDGYLVRIERALTELLPRPQQVKFNRDALLRSDTVTRYQAHSTGLTAGFLTVDEVREMEDRPPLPDVGGDGSTAREIAELIQKIYLGVGVVLSPDEAREIANRAGAGLSGSLPVEPAAEPAPGSPDDMIEDTTDAEPSD